MWRRIESAFLSSFFGPKSGVFSTERLVFGSCGNVLRMDHDRNTLTTEIAFHVEQIMRILGVDPDHDPEVAGTPDRVAALAVELTSGMCEPENLAVLADENAGSGLVIARNLPFHSLCAHHMLPFFGKAHIGYLPGSGVLGIGSLGRVLDHYARRFQLQERLGEQVAEFLVSKARTEGAIVVIEARQLCMEMRGGRKTGLIQSTAARGALEQGELRREFFLRLALSQGENNVAD